MVGLTIPSLDELVQRTRAMLATVSGRVLVGVTGAPGAGKSTLSEALVQALGDDAALVPMDGYHLANEELIRLGLRDRKGAPATFDRLGFATVLARLRAAPGPDDHPIYLPRFQREIDAAVAGAIPVRAGQRLLIVEGNYLMLWPEVRAQLDQVWFVDPPSDARLSALIARHVQFGRTEAAAREWVLRSDEANAAVVSPHRDHADLIVRWATPTPSDL